MHELSAMLFKPSELFISTERRYRYCSFELVITKILVHDDATVCKFIDRFDQWLVVSYGSVWKKKIIAKLETDGIFISKHTLFMEMKYLYPFDEQRALCQSIT